MAEQQDHERWHYRPGEMVIATELPDDDAIHNQAHGLLRDTVEQQLAGSIGGVFHAQQRRAEPLIFRAPDRPPLGFFFYDLEPQQAQPHGYAKAVISATHADDMAAIAPVRQRGLTPLGVMPHWLGSAQQDYTDGSPATLPRPTRPPADGRWKYHYAPLDTGFEFAADGPRIPVLILDTRPNWARAREELARFTQNAQLAELIDLLGRATLPRWHSDALDASEDEGLPLAHAPGGGRGNQDISDHALFIAGLIHDLSPRAELHIRPVLNRFGVGDLHLLLRVLADVMTHKDRNAPLIVNMSLGFAPKLEHLPWVWYGVDKPNDDSFEPDVPIHAQLYDARAMARNYHQVAETTRLLHVGLERLSEYLLANNCLGVAAAGNDSLHNVETGRPRLGPRIPARYRSILGVAATHTEPSEPAEYSNIGDEVEFGDHIATFGGGVGQHGEPREGVIGVYTGPQFPASRGGPAPENTSGWALWSGTSFATGIVAGLVSAYWGTQRQTNPDIRADDVLLTFNDLADTYVPALRTRSVRVRGDWQRV